VKLIVAEKRRYPSWGPVPLRKLLKRKWPKLPWPATSTVGAILKREGLVRTRTYRSRVAPRTKPFLSVREPNDVWCIDFKGQFETRDCRLSGATDPAFSEPFPPGFLPSHDVG
jgi:putative transposase